MKRLPLLLLAVLVVAAFAAPLSAQEFIGTFSGDCSGTWEGTLYQSAEPIRFEGRWESEEGGTGTLEGIAEIGANNWYYVREGDILDEDGQVIGTWEGKFPPESIDAQATGTWRTEQGDGSWTGYKP